MEPTTVRPSLYDRLISSADYQPGMAAKPGLRHANGMTGKVSSSGHNSNGAPVKGTHKGESIDNAGTNGTRVNGAATNGANGH